MAAMEDRACGSKGLIGVGSGSWRDWGLGPATGWAEGQRPATGDPSIYVCVMLLNCKLE